MIQTNINQHDLNQNSDSEQSDEHHLIILKIRKTEESNFELEAKKQSNPNLFYISLLKGQFHYLHDLSIGMQIGVKGRFDRENKLTIDNSERLLIIVDPHKSIAVTSLGNYIFCPRKKLISEINKGKTFHNIFERAFFKSYSKIQDQQLKEIIQTIINDEKQIIHQCKRHSQILNDFTELNLNDEKLQAFYHFYFWVEKWKHQSLKVKDQFGKEHSIKLSKYIQSEIQLQEKFLGLNGRPDILVEVIENNIENNFKNNIESVLIDIKTGSFRHSDELQIKSYLSLINYQEIVKQNGMMYQKQVIQYGMIIYLKDDKVNQENIKLFTYSESMIQEQLDKRNKYLLSNHKSQSQDIEDFFNNLPDPNLEQLESGCSLCHHQFLCSYKNLNSQKSNQSLIELQQRKNIKKYDLTKMSEKSKQYLNIMLKDLTKEEFEHLYLKQFELTVEIQKEGDEYKLELLKLFDEKMLKIFEQFIKSNKILTIALYTETYQFTITKGLQYKQVDNLNKIFIIGKFQTDDFDKARYPFLIQYYNPFYSYKQIIVDLVGVFIQQTNTDSNVFKNKLQLNKLLIQEEKPQIEQQINNIEQNSSKEVQLCLNAKDYVLVQSGEQNKERMLFELLKVLENQKKHVLICVEKPKTLVKLCKHCPNKNILAIPQKNSDELKEINEYLIDYKCQDQQQINDIWNQKYFYFSICDDYSQNKFRFQEFDYCILYEASKILEPLCIICIWTSKKFILFGKSNEKPEVKSNSVSQLKISLFERLSKIAQETGVFIDIDEDHQQMNI